MLFLSELIAHTPDLVFTTIFSLKLLSTQFLTSFRLPFYKLLLKAKPLPPLSPQHLLPMFYFRPITRAVLFFSEPLTPAHNTTLYQHYLWKSTTFNISHNGSWLRTCSVRIFVNLLYQLTDSRQPSLRTEYDANYNIIASKTSLL